MTEARSRRARSGRASMVQAAAGMFTVGLVGLVCSAVRASASVNPRGTLAAPFRNKPAIRRNFGQAGATEARKSFIRMTPDQPDKAGALWSSSTLRSTDLSLEWKFRIGGTMQEKYGGTLAVVISPTTYEVGEFFGIDANFTGLAIIVDSNQQLIPEYREPGNHASRRRDVVIAANDGTRSYEDLVSNLDGCMANVKFGENIDNFDLLQSSRIRLKVHDNKVSVDIDAGNKGWWQRCVTRAQIDMPAKWMYDSHIGVIAQTSERSSNQDLVRLQVYTDPDEAWNTNIYHADKKEMEGAVQRKKLGVLSRRSAMKVQPAEPEHMENPASIRETRILGLMALKKACSDNADFSRCHHDRGSARELEECLQKRDGNISAGCTEGIQAWKTLLIETAPGARNMVPALGKEPPGAGGSTHSHAAKNRAKESQPAPLGSLSEKLAVGGFIGNNGSDHERTSKYRRDPTAPKESDSVRSSSRGNWLPGEQDDGGDGGGGGQGGPPPRNHDQKQHDPHSGEASRSHHPRGAGGVKRVDPNVHSTKADLIAAMSNPSGAGYIVDMNDPSIFDSTDSEDIVKIFHAEDRFSLFVGYLSLGLIIVFVVTRAVKTLARHTNRHRGADGDDAPGGYQALPEDDDAAAASTVPASDRPPSVSASGEGDYVDDDDALVVTGTPVNPPPSAHL